MKEAIFEYRTKLSFGIGAESFLVFENKKKFSAYHSHFGNKAVLVGKIPNTAENRKKIEEYKECFGVNSQGAMAIKTQLFL